MKIKVFGLSNVGRKRKKNEDSFLVNTQTNLFVVADGMGGHSGGEFASQFAVSTIEEVIQSLSSDSEATLISGVNSDNADFGDQLRYAIQMASQKIYDQSLFDQGLRGMGTTVVALWIRENRACVANVGDSRAYLFRGGKLKQLTTDHSLVREQMQAGLISENDAKNHQFRNIITRSVGYQEDVEIDIEYIDLKHSDKFIMCTDGLTNMVSDGLILKIVQDRDPKAACEELIRLSNENGGEDNITVVICEVDKGA